MATPPSKKLRFAAIGCDRMAWKDISTIGMHKNVEVVALCDIDRKRFANAEKAWPGLPKFSDFRKLFDQMGDEFDAVNVTVPDHSHAVITQEALRRGKHVYCQKPLTHTVWEARQIAKLAAKAGTVTRMGNQIHSEFQYRVSRVLIQEEKKIGKVKEVHTWIDAAGHGRSGLLEPPVDPQKPPPHIDWEQWIGPAPFSEYGGENVYHPRCWRDWQNYGSGSIGDNGCHLFDPLFTALDLTAPISVTADHSGMNEHVWPAQETLRYVFPGTEYTASDTLEVTWYDGGRRPRWKIKGLPPAETLIQPASMIIGENGYLLVPHWGIPKLFPEEDFAGYELPDPGKANHWHDWVDACLEGNPDISDNFAYAGPLTEAVQLGNVAVRLPGQSLDWDTENLRVTNVEEANAYLTKQYRKGWEVEPV